MKTSGFGKEGKPAKIKVVLRPYCGYWLHPCLVVMMRSKFLAGFSSQKEGGGIVLSYAN